MASIFLTLSILFGADYSISVAKAVEETRLNAYISELPEETRIAVITNLSLAQLMQINVGG